MWLKLNVLSHQEHTQACENIEVLTLWVLENLDYYFQNTFFWKELMPVSIRINFRLLEMLIFTLNIFSKRERIIIISKELLLFNNYYFKQEKVLLQNTDTMFCKNYLIYINPTPERSDETAHDFSTHRKDFFFIFMCLVTQSCPTLCNPMDCSPPSFSVHRDSPGKNTGVGCHALLQGIFPTQRLNPGPPHWRWILTDWATREAFLFIGCSIKSGRNSIYCVSRTFPLLQSTMKKNEEIIKTHQKRLFQAMLIREVIIFCIA